jgi:hypothetical protein
MKDATAAESSAFSAVTLPMRQRSRLLSFVAIAGAVLNALAPIAFLLQGQAHLVLASMVASALCLMVYLRFIVGPLGLTAMYLINFVAQIAEASSPAEQAGVAIGTALGLATLWGLWLWDGRVAAKALKMQRLQADQSRERSRQDAEAEASKRFQRSRVRQLERELAKARKEATQAKEMASARGNALVP